MKPFIKFIETITAQNTNAGWTYNQSGTTYNQAGLQYGGSDRNNQNAKPSIGKIEVA
jgi:hypothetical protein